MGTLAGTSRGVFTIDGGEPSRVLESTPVRDLTVVNGRVFAGTEDGLFASDDQGATWRCVGLEGLQVWTVRPRPGDDDVLYAGTQPAHLFTSTDGGDSWTEIESFSTSPEAAAWCIPLDPPLPGRARAIVIDEDDPQRMWVGVEVGGVMRTEDGGESWHLDLPGENPDIHMMWPHPDEPNVLFASTGYGRPDHIAEEIEGNAGVFRSDDHGHTWEYRWKGIVPRYSRTMCIDRREPYALTVASAPTAFSSRHDDDGAQAMLFRSEDQGVTWRSLCDDAHSPSAANFHGLTVDPNCVGGVLVGTDTGEVWKVTDDAEWTSVAAGLPTVLSLLVTA